MKKIITLALVFVLALSLLTACGSNDNGGGSSTTPPANSSTPGTSQGAGTTPSNADGDTTEWPDDEVGNLVSKPSFDYKVKRYLVGEGRKILTVEFPGATKEQIQSYLETIHQEVSATYPDASPDSHWDDDDVWGESFSFENETGMDTMVSLKWYAEDDAELMIEWVLK